jgi:hypothetical protein
MSENILERGSRTPQFKSEEPCAACSFWDENMVCYHHIYTRGSHPEYKLKKWNCLPLCAKHHVEIHAGKTSDFVKKYYSIYLWFIKNDWFFCEIQNKWRHE